MQPCVKSAQNYLTLKQNRKPLILAICLGILDNVLKSHIRSQNYEDFVETSDKYQRPNEVNYLTGDYSKAEKNLGWSPKTSLKELIKLMVEHDIEKAKKEKILFDKGLLKPTWEHPA